MSLAPSFLSVALVPLSHLSRSSRYRVATLVALALILVVLEARSDEAAHRSRSAITLLVAVGLGALIAFDLRRLRSNAAHQRAASFRAMAEQSPDAIVVHADGVVLYANAAAARLRGEHSAEAMIGQGAHSYLHPDHLDEVAERERVLLEDGTPSSPRLFRMVRADGSIVEAEARGAVVDYLGGRAIQVVLRDVAERRTFELALQLSEQRFRAIIEAMDEGVVLQDCDLKFRQWNPAAERLLGLSADQMAGGGTSEDRWQAIDENGLPLPAHEHMAAVAMRTGSTEKGLMGVVRGDGRRHWIHVNAVPLLMPDEQKPYAVVSTFNDVTVAHESRRALKESEARYRAMIDRNPDSILVQSHGVIRYVNNALAELYGVEAADYLTGRDVSTLLHVDDRRAVRERLLTMEQDAGAPVPRISRLVRIDGSIAEVESRGTRILFDGQHAVEIVLRDVSARREAERALQLSESRFRAVLNGMEEGVVLFSADHRAQLWNAAAERTLGLSHVELRGGRLTSLATKIVDLNGTPIPPSRYLSTRSLRSGRVSSGKFGILVDPTTTRWLRAKAVPLFREGEETAYAVVTTFADVTDEEATARRIRESEERYRLLANNSGDMISVRTEDDTLLWASPSHEAVLGYSPSELIGRCGTDFVHPDDIRGIQAGAQAQIVRGEIPAPSQCRVRHKDGHWLWVEVVASPLPPTEQGAPRYLISARDITARQLLEEELRQSQKMEAMGRMAGAMAHDVNNLLTVIQSSADLVRATDDADDMVAHFSDLDGALERAAALTSQLLAFGRRQHVSPRELRIADVLRDDVGLLTRMTSPRVRLELAIDASADQASIWADRGQIEQALFNLVMNARDASVEGGVVRLRCAVSAQDDEQPHRFGAIPAGETIALCIEDTGSGIPEGVLDHLFEPFHSTKPQGKGTGLGLSTAYGIVNQARGTITVDTTPGSGSVFCVYWPLFRNDRASAGLASSERTARSVREVVERHARVRSETLVASPAATTVASDADASRHANPHLLLVDDDDGVRKVMARLLGHAGYQVTALKSAAAAIAYLAKADTIAGMITDVRMPGMSGVELVEQLSRDGRAMPVLFVSGQLDAPLPEAMPTNVAPRFLHKPFTTEELLRAVESLLHSR